jgi:carbon-monoxide dehydrogenase medium subunit
LKPAPFRYHAPRSVDEAVALLASLEESRILAGGQSLVPAMALRLAMPANIIDINEIGALHRLTAEDGWLRIGALVRHAAFEQPAVEGPLGELLATVVRYIAHHPIRTRGTFCGSLAHADPASEWCLVAATLGARLIARSARGTRTIAVEQFFQGVMTTALAQDELLVEARLPLLAAGTRFAFCEYSRRSGDFAIAMALTMRGEETHIGLGGVEAVPRRIASAEAPLEPLHDPRYSAAYRRDLARTLVRRTLDQCS